MSTTNSKPRTVRLPMIATVAGVVAFGVGFFALFTLENMGVAF